tara:strand:+ start:493 stop:753 length:261 start_codon:yes stop_codon:yes gene_type:complete
MTTKDYTERNYYAKAAEEELKNARKYFEGQGAFNRRREQEVKDQAAAAIYKALTDDVRRLTDYEVPAGYRLRLLQQAKTIVDLVGL